MSTATTVHSLPETVRPIARADVTQYHFMARLSPVNCAAMKSAKGFTITEFMVVVAIAAILLGIGVPSYLYITNSYRMSAEVNSLLGDLQYARAEAIREGQTVTTCVSNDGQTCLGTTNWQSGWIVYSNPANNNAPAVGSVLRVQAAFTGTVPDTFVANNAISAVTFNREGFATTAAGFPNVTITLQESTNNASWRRCLLISPVGLVNTQNHVANPGTC
jgi:type IV fimbrial biogenesis protein FimT